MDITIHSSFLPHDDPEASLAFYRDTLGFELRNDVGYNGMRWLTVGPPGPARHLVVLHPPAADPGITDDERRTITEMMAKGTYAMLLLATPGPRRHLREAAGRATSRSSRSRPTSPTASATAPSATPPATWSASTRCAEMTAIAVRHPRGRRHRGRRGLLHGRLRARRHVGVRDSEAPTTASAGSRCRSWCPSRAPSTASSARPSTPAPPTLKPADEELLGLRRRRAGPGRDDLEVATSSKKDTGPATRDVDDVVLLLGVADVKASKQFYVERGLAVAQELRQQVRRVRHPGLAGQAGALRAPGRSPRTPASPPDGTGSHRIVDRRRRRRLHRPRRVRWEAASA